MQEKLDSSYDICALVNLILIFVIYKILKGFKLNSPE